MTKKCYISIIILLVLVLIGGLYFLDKPQTETVLRGDVKSAEQSTTTLPIIVTALNHDVFLKGVEKSQFETVPTSASTSVGATVKTSDVGRALIESEAAHKTLLDYNTKIVLTDSSRVDNQNKTSIGLLAGAIWSRLEKVLDKGEFYEIKTSNAVAVVRGTAFGVWYLGDTTILEVTEGSVSFAALDDSGIIIPGTEIIVSAGEKATRKGKGAIVKVSISLNDKETKWYLFNNNSATTTRATSSPVIIPKTTTSGGASVNVPKTQTAPSSGGGSATTFQTGSGGGSAGAPGGPKTPIVLKGIRPSTVSAYDGTLITLYGSGFNNLRTITIDTNPVKSFNIVDDNTATFSQSLDPGTYDIIVENIFEEGDVLDKALTVNPPQLKRAVNVQ